MVCDDVRGVNDAKSIYKPDDRPIAAILQRQAKEWKIQNRRFSPKTSKGKEGYPAKRVKKFFLTLVIALSHNLEASNSYFRFSISH